MRVEDPDNELTLCDTAIIIIWEKNRDERGIPREHGAKVIYHCGEYDDPITLNSILKEYPTVQMVISEYGIHGKVFRYGNHGDFWEEVGKTQGYA